jgi:hypothetical protein
MHTFEDSRSEYTGPWVRWGPSFAGAITAIAVTALVMSLWLALGYGSKIDWFVDNMQWFFLGTTLLGLLCGGLVAGAVSRARGTTVGMIDGLMVWGLALMAALIPLSLRTLALANAGTPAATTRTALGVSSGNLWALFGVLVGGLLCAVIGGSVTGSPKRRALRNYEAEPVEETRPTAAGVTTPRRVG